MGTPELKKSLLQGVIKARNNAVVWVTLSRNYINEKLAELTKELGEPERTTNGAPTS